MTMTGKQLQDVLEVSVNGHHAIFQVSGMKMTYDPRQPIGKRVLSAEIGGKPIEPEKEYRVVPYPGGRGRRIRGLHAGQ